MFLVISGILNQLKNLFSRHPNIQEVPRNDPWQNLEMSFFYQNFLKKSPPRSTLNDLVPERVTWYSESEGTDLHRNLERIFGWNINTNERLDFDVFAKHSQKMKNFSKNKQNVSIFQI